MGKLNELSVLAEAAGFGHIRDFEELRVACMKHMLANIARTPQFIELVKTLALWQTREQLIEYVHVTKEQAMALHGGAILHHYLKRNRDGTPMRVRVSGKCQTWKTRPAEFKLPVKYGMYDSGYIDQNNCGQWYVA